MYVFLATCNIVVNTYVSQLLSITVPHQYHVVMLHSLCLHLAGGFSCQDVRMRSHNLESRTHSKALGN